MDFFLDELIDTPTPKGLGDPFGRSESVQDRRAFLRSPESAVAKALTVNKQKPDPRN